MSGPRPDRAAPAGRARHTLGVVSSLPSTGAPSRVMGVPGYAAADRERWVAEDPAQKRSDRHDFARDRARVLHSAALRRLAATTQVVAPTSDDFVRNRLTHSLEVAQIGREFGAALGCDADVVDAACLAHDIGHPPFGHIGEIAIRDAVRELSETPRRDGFQANAQNLRIATYLSVRRHRADRGLNLTRATLDASIKYPWCPIEKKEGEPETEYASKHWGCYDDAETKTALAWVLNDSDAPYAAPSAAPGNSAPPGLRRPVEEQIMDWADEVTYACHDVEDFYRAGMLPLGQIFDGVPRTDVRKGEPNSPGFETNRFIRYLVESQTLEEHRAIELLQNLQNKLGSIFPFEATAEGRGRSTQTVSSLIAYFMGPKPTAGETGPSNEFRVMLRPIDSSGTLTRHNAVIEVHDDLRDACHLLKAMIWHYVIDRPSLATQQRGQKRIVTDLISWYANDPKRLLPRDRQEEWVEHKDAVRAAVDAVANLTESEAVRIHRRMSGLDWGQITDLA